jgi:hypothetical protein
MHGLLRHFITFTGRPEYPIPAGGFASICTIRMRMKPPFTKAMTIEVGVGADQALPKVIRRRVEQEQLKGAFVRAREEALDQGDLWSTLFPFAPNGMS